MDGRIVDIVFERGGSPRARWNTWAAVMTAAALHGALWLWARSAEPSLESWSAGISARVHAELGRNEVVELAQSPPPPPPERVPDHEPHQPAPPIADHPPQLLRPSRTPPPPAQAGQVVAQEPNLHDPVDLTGDTFVTGTANAYAGGTTTRNGTNPVAVLTRAVDPSAPPTQNPGEPDQSSPVRLEGAEWQCTWPHEAETEQIDEQAVILRVVVAVDGSAERATLVSDPGHGFGPAAVACALRTRFTPAHDRHGRPIKAQSPPIRVRFTR